MRQRTPKQMEEMNKLFREIGAGEAYIPSTLKEAKMFCEGQREHVQCEFSQVCQKTIYPSQAYAEKVAAGRRKKGAGRLRVYKCETCHGFHLTGYIPSK
jgi:hypothetical protein